MKNLSVEAEKIKKISMSFNNSRKISEIVFINACIVIVGAGSMQVAAHGGFDHTIPTEITATQKNRLEGAAIADVTVDKCEETIAKAQTTSSYAADISDAFDKTVTQLEDFAEQANLNDDQYTNYMDEVVEAREHAQVETAVLEILSYEIDCEEGDAGQYLNAISVTNALAYEALVEYQSQLVRVLSYVAEVIAS